MSRTADVLASWCGTANVPPVLPTPSTYHPIHSRPPWPHQSTLACGLRSLPFPATVLPGGADVPPFDEEGWWPPRFDPHERIDDRDLVYTRTMTPFGGERWAASATPPVIQPWAVVYGRRV